MKKRRRTENRTNRTQNSRFTYHALAFSEEAASKLFDAGMKIFRGDASTMNALKLCFSGGVTVCIYREIADIDNGVFRVRVWDRPSSYDEKTMSRAAVKKFCLEKIRAEFAETEAA